MYDKKVIIPGLVIFVWLMTLPVWYNLGKANPQPDPKIDTPVINQMVVKKCIESKQYMKESHMQVLNEWRDEVVRNKKRVYIASNGEKHDISLQNECMRCHSNKKDFCDSCHNYVAVKPFCWDCHLEPKEK
ncbi:MAG: sulfate reduction electron transfer complex DsrMKJOP subunit DsrJ [Pseudomonadota bacterium]